VKGKILATEHWPLTTASMTWIKICGMTNLEDALVAVEAGADAVGFVFHDRSPRTIDVETARRIVNKLPAQMEKVGVFVGEPSERVNEVAVQAGLSAVQFYHVDGKPGSGDYLELSQLGIAQEHGRKLIIAISNAELKNCSAFIGSEEKKHIYAMLIDSGTGDRVGGTGVPFDWESLRDRVHGLNLVLPVIVAGGLNSENVDEAIEVLKPWGVDVVSGVEARPGKKDPEKVRAFVNAVRAAKSA
jgi:phosphoribosylanthranilate isomerase